MAPLVENGRLFVHVDCGMTETRVDFQSTINKHGLQMFYAVGNPKRKDGMQSGTERPSAGLQQVGLGK